MQPPHNMFAVIRNGSIRERSEKDYDYALRSHAEARKALASAAGPAQVDACREWEAAARDALLGLEPLCNRHAFMGAKAIMRQQNPRAAIARASRFV